MKKICLLALAGLFVVSAVHANVVREKFATDPALDGWQAFGDTNLFQWDSTNHVLDVTWDSTQTNSYYYHPLGRTYTAADGFYVQFDLQLKDAVAFNSGTELAIGLLHWSDVTGPDFSRANFTSPNVCEFDYFPSFTYSGQIYPDSVEATMIDDTGNGLFFASSNLTLNVGITYRIALIHQPGAGTLSCEISTKGQLIASLPPSYGSVTSFELDTLSINSYADDGFGDDILAHGVISDLAFASPLPVGLVQTPLAGQVQFKSDTNWLYTLQQTSDFQAWTNAAAPVIGNGTNLLLQATNPPADHSFYHVRADLP